VCAAGVSCINGACQETAICTPACHPERECFEGACTCVANGECEGREDLAGEFCVNPPGHPTIGVCGCLDGLGVCAVALLTGEGPASLSPTGAALLLLAAGSGAVFAILGRSAFAGPDMIAVLAAAARGSIAPVA
jgi:hypothetical protein